MIIDIELIDQPFTLVGFITSKINQNKEGNVLYMAVSLIEKNYSTNYCKFSYDNWENDKDSIPTMNTRGKGVLSTILSCSQGSKAIGTDGTMKILNGDSNKWIDYSVGSGGSSGGGSSSEGTDLNIATDEEVDGMLDDVFENK